MPDLGGQAILRWAANLTRDVLAVLKGQEAPSDEAALAGLIGKLSAAPLSEAAAIIRRHDKTVVAMGRTRRLRLLSWLSNRVGGDHEIPFFTAVFVNPDEEGGDAASRPMGARLFLEDVRVANRMIVAPRMSRHIDSHSLEVVTRSSLGAVIAPPTGGRP